MLAMVDGGSLTCAEVKDVQSHVNDDILKITDLQNFPKNTAKIASKMGEESAGLPIIDALFKHLNTLLFLLLSIFLNACPWHDFKGLKNASGCSGVQSLMLGEQITPSPSFNAGDHAVIIFGNDADDVEVYNVVIFSRSTFEPRRP